MGSMREIRTRINSVQSTMKITNAMYLMSSSKLKRARTRLDATAPYFTAIQDTMAEILAHLHETEHEYFTPCGEKVPPEEARKRAYVVITSDKGLAGAYNHNVIKLTEEYLKKGKDNTLLFVGYNARNYFQRKQREFPGLKLDDEYSYPAVDPEYWRALYMAEHLIQLYRGRQIDEIYLIYTRMVNAMTSNAEMLRMLPLDRDMFPSAPPEEEHSYETSFVPSPHAVLRQLVPNYLMGLIYGGMIESYASEQNARMQAMDNATSNAKEMVKDLSLLYNRVRQAAITQEITEVVGGAQAQE